MIRVRDYMVLAVEHIRKDSTVGEAIDQLLHSRYHGLPVTDEKGKLVGFVSAKELLRNATSRKTPLQKILRPGTHTATPDLALDDAARVMFRYGLRDLPVIDESGKLCGILANIDVVRSHFERASPAKAETLRSLLTERYHLSFSFRRGSVPISHLIPTQPTVYEDELEGRRYELERGFAEPVLVIHKGDHWILVDGHHRALAAREMGLSRLQAFLLTCDRPQEFATYEIGLERTARDHHLQSLADIQVDRTGHHPLVEVTTQLLHRIDGESPSSPIPSPHHDG